MAKVKTYDAFAIDAYVRRPVSAAGAVQHLRCKHGHHVRPFRQARQRARLRLLVERRPPEVVAGVGCVVVGGALLRTEVRGSRWTWL